MSELPETERLRREIMEMLELRDRAVKLAHENTMATAQNRLVIIGIGLAVLQVIVAILLKVLLK